MISIDKNYYEEYIIQKSKFYSFAYPVFTESECKKYLEEIRNNYQDATHVCFAYILSSPRVEKCSDDGEPTGTAGKPIMELIKKKKLENVLVVVVRYFGGIKLGAGGLVRAYTHSASLTLEKCSLVHFEESRRYLLKVGSDIAGKIKSTIESMGGKVDKIVYLDRVHIEFFCNNIEELKKIYKVDVECLGSEMYVVNH